MAERAAELNETAELPLDLFKWAISVFVGLLLFLGIGYERAYFRAFGIADFAPTKDVSQIASNAVELLLRPSIALTLLAIGFAGWVAWYRVGAKFRALVMGLAIVAAFGASGQLARREARTDATDQLTGKSGRAIWCNPKADQFDADLLDGFKAETANGNFRLLFERDGYFFIHNVMPRPAGKGEANDLKGNSLIIKRDDVTLCRVSGDKL